MDLDQRKRVLLLAVGDMDQVIEAAQAIQRTEERDPENMELVRALETAVAVCYWRPFTNSSIGRLDPEADAPEDDDLRELHWELKTVRDKVYAHTDEEAGREVNVREMGGGSHVITETWDPLPSDWLPDVIALAQVQHARFLDEALD
jgi:hypothetical protein